MTRVLKDRGGRTVLFDEEKHEYFMGNDKFFSVTRFVGSFFPVFDKVAVAEKIAFKRNYNVQDLLDEWEEGAAKASAKGHHLHQYADSLVKGQPFEEDFKYADYYQKINTAFKKIKSKFEIIGSEVIVVSPMLSLAGTIDLLCKDGNDILIFDWKTSKAIERENVWESALSPIEHLDACNWNHYSLQLNVYERICKEEYDPPGTKYRKALIDIQSRSEPLFLKVDDLQKEVEHMIGWI